jgi:hypothetical protein
MFLLLLAHFVDAYDCGALSFVEVGNFVAVVLFIVSVLLVFPHAVFLHASLNCL